jgi:SAM-dependent methyltransferase
MPADWWRHYFDETFFRLHDPLFPEQASREEVAAILELVGLTADARVLDLPCGWGRHTRLLAGAGFAAFGADISEPLLRRAVAEHGAGGDGGDGGDGGEPPRYAAADLRALPFAAASFDAVLNVFTSLGLFLEDDEDVAALREARRVLAPGGVFLLESMHRDDVVASFAPRDHWRLPDGTEVRVQRRFDPVTGVSRERWRWRRGDEAGEKRHALRLRTATEIDRLLRLAGFLHIEYFGDWDGTPMTHDAPRLIAVARG